jgi:hypothetical protein
MNGLASLLRYQMGGPVGYVTAVRLILSTTPYLVDLRMKAVKLITKTT